MNKLFKPLILLIFLLPGCAKKSSNKTVYNSHQKNSNLYELKVEGIECKLCASLSLRALESLPEVSKAEFVCLDKEFKNYFIKLYLKNNIKEPNVKNLKNALKKEGFSLVSIKGDFDEKSNTELKLDSKSGEFKIRF